MNADEVQFIAVDFETTGLDPFVHGPLSIGLKNDEHEIYAKMCPDGAHVDARAMEVNGFNLRAIAQHESHPIFIDLELYKMLQETYDPERPFEMVGLNAGQFDYQFMRKWLPNTRSLFSHRPFDLNTMFRTLNYRDYREIRKVATERAYEVTGLTEDDMHDAFNDARVAWEIFKDHILSQASPF